MTPLVLILLLAASAWGSLNDYPGGPVYDDCWNGSSEVLLDADSSISGAALYVPALVDLERIHFRQMLIREWRAYQQACKTDSFLVPTGYYTGHADTTQLDSLGRCFILITTPDSMWVRRDSRSFPEFMSWIEKEFEK